MEEERKIPNSLYERFLQERAELYALLWKIDDAIVALASGNVASYTLGNRSVSYQNLDQIKALKRDTLDRIEELEAWLSHRAPRNVTTNCFLDPSITVPRKL